MMSSTECLLEAYRSGGSAKAREELVVQHLGLVRRIAWNHSLKSPSQLEDLCQVGAIGLIQAIERYDPGTGRNFEAYAGACISGEILHYQRDLANLVRIPRDLQELRPRVVRESSRLWLELEREPEAGELAACLGVPEPKVAEVLAVDQASETVSLDEEAEAADGRPTGRYHLIDNRYRSFQLAEEDRIMLSDALGRLRKVSREVIEFAFYQDLTQTEIARKLGISQMQVSRRVKTALGELMKALTNRPPARDGA